MIFEIEKLAEKFGKRTAFSCKDEKITYSELFEKAKKIAENLSGDKNPVIVFGGRNINSFASIIACIISKRAYVPVEPNLPEERREKIISLSKASVILDCRGTEIEFKKTENKCEPISENETAYIIFTSGSTGNPKGVPLSYENLDNFIGWITALEPLSLYENSGVLSHASFSFDLSTASIFCSLLKGNKLVQLSGNGDFDEIFSAIEKEKPEVFVATPTFFRLCLMNKDFSAENFPFIKCVYFCGETLQKSLVKTIFERFPDMQVINAYGPTEAASAVCAIEITKEILEREELLPVGILSSAAAEITAENGEIVLKGKSVSKGYLSGEAGGFYKENGKNCFRTGDMGYIENGKIYCKGRSDSQIKYKGYRIELSEIEAVISSVSGAENCAVIAKRNPEGEIRLIKAFVSGNIAEEKIREELSKKLPEYMIPKSIKIMDYLPLNKNGKTDRKELLNL